MILNEIAIVRGAPGTDAAVAQSYLGIFSPSRATYQLRVPGGALLALPMNGDMFGGTTAQLDVLQGDPSRVRDLSVGFGSLRTIRAEASTTAPKMRRCGSTRAGSGAPSPTTPTRALIAPALVLGSSAVKLADLPAGKSADVDLRLTRTASTGRRSRIPWSAPYDWDGGPMDEDPAKAHPAGGHRPAHVRPQPGISGVLPGDSPTCSPGATSRSSTPSSRAGGPPRGQRPVRGPADDRDPRPQHVRRRSPRARPDRRQRQLLHEGPVEPQLRDRRGHDGLPAAPFEGR